MKKLYLLFAVLCFPAMAQTVWYPIATLSGNQNPLVTTTAVVTYRYGTDSGTTLGKLNCAVAPGCWLAPVTATLTNFPTLWSTFPSDPAQGVSKQFEIAETCSAQTGTIGGTAFTVPALPASSCTAAPPSPTVVGTFTATCTLYSDKTISCAVPAKMVSQ